MCLPVICENYGACFSAKQNLLEFPISVGGRTALELQGHTHYLAMSASSEIHLYGNKVPPSWVARLKLDRRIVFHSALLFKSTLDGVKITNQDQQKANFMEQNWRASEWTFQISTSERAILEVIDELPNHESFHQIDVLMESLSNLRPQYLNRMLADCRSVKTKRLFLWFAHRHNHAWFKMIDCENIDIGKGKRIDSSKILLLQGSWFTHNLAFGSFVAIALESNRNGEKNEFAS